MSRRRSILVGVVSGIVFVVLIAVLAKVNSRGGEMIRLLTLNFSDDINQKYI